jgi:hypothetical protein
MCCNHLLHLVNILPECIDGRPRTQRNIEVLGPASHDVQVQIRDRELVPNQVLAIVEHVVIDIRQLLLELLNLSCLGVTLEPIEQWPEGGVYLTGDIVQSSLLKVAIGRSPLPGNSSRSLREIHNKIEPH